MANVELNYYNGSTYEVLYPKIAWTNNSGGTIATANIPDLSASKITSGTFSVDRIPTLNASKITTGTFGGAKGTEYIFPGNLRIGGTGSSSDAYLRIGDSDYVHLHEDTDDMLTIKAKRINFLTTNTPGLTQNGVALGSGLQAFQSSYTGTGSTTTMTASTGFSTKLILLIPDQYHKGIFAMGLSNMNYYGGIIVTTGSNGSTIEWSVVYNSTNVQFQAPSTSINLNPARYCYICIG